MQLFVLSWVSVQLSCRLDFRFEAWIWFMLKLEWHSLLSLTFAQDGGTVETSLFLQDFSFVITKPLWGQQFAFELSCICTRARSLAWWIQKGPLNSKDFNTYNERMHLIQHSSVYSMWIWGYVFQGIEALPVLCTPSWVIFMVLHVSHGQLDFFGFLYTEE